jgi:hypothetical protein
LFSFYAHTRDTFRIGTGLPRIRGRTAIDGPPKREALGLGWCIEKPRRDVPNRLTGQKRRGGAMAAGRPVAKGAVWCWHSRIDQIERGTALMIASPRAALVHWDMNGWMDGEAVPPYHSSRWRSLL